MTTNTHRDETCPDCGGRVLPVMYGMPGDEAMRAAERGELFLGGCMIEDVAFRCDCGATTYLFDDTASETFDVATTTPTSRSTAGTTGPWTTESATPN